MKVTETDIPTPGDVQVPSTMDQAFKGQPKVMVELYSGAFAFLMKLAGAAPLPGGLNSPDSQILLDAQNSINEQISRQFDELNRQAREPAGTTTQRPAKRRAAAQKKKTAAKKKPRSKKS